MGGAGSWDDGVGSKVAVGTWRVMDRDGDRQKQCSTLFSARLADTDRPCFGGALPIETREGRGTEYLYGRVRGGGERVLLDTDR